MTGLLLINLGTPDAPTPSAVRRYLREFLSDPRVLDMNGFGRFLLLNFIILPFRPKQSAEAYKKIWDDTRGSPLLYHGQDLTALVQQRLGKAFHVALAMRYGAPSIRQSLSELRAKGIDRLIAFPLFPQYASSSGGSALQEVLEVLKDEWNVANLCTIEPFYDHPAFVKAFASVGASVLDSMQPDHILFSFHGLPERQILKSDDSGQCLAKPECCDAMTAANRNCYRAQSYATARALAETLSLDEKRYTVCFQSRLGKIPWIKPYTDEALTELAQSGVKKLAVFCPAFVADCLETLEEIGMRAKEQFIEEGGEQLELVPSLNASDMWADAVCTIVRDQCMRYGATE